MNYISFILAFGLTLHFTLVLMRVAPKIGLLDLPGGRKSHSGSVPLVGGLAVFLGFTFALLALPQPLGGLRAFLAGSAMVLIVGVLDDLHELSSGNRFIVQILAALCMVYFGDVRLADLGYLVDTHDLLALGFWSVPLTVFAMVGVINALNMIDGVDGLAGGLSAITLAGLGVLAWQGENPHAFNMLILLLMCVAGFLVFNLRLPWQPRARVFLGDAGSMFLGFALAWFLIDLSQGEGRNLSPAVALWLFAVPLIDTVTQMSRRLLQRRSPFEPDRQHVHHALLHAGLSPSQVLLIMVAAALVCAAVGLTGQWQGWPEPALFYGFLALFSAHFLVMQRAWSVRRFLGRELERRSGPQRRAANQPITGAERRCNPERRRGGAKAGDAD